MVIHRTDKITVMCAHMWSPPPHTTLYTWCDVVVHYNECATPENRVKPYRAIQSTYVIFMCAYVTFYDYDHDYCKLQRIGRRVVVSILMEWCRFWLCIVLFYYSSTLSTIYTTLNKQLPYQPIYCESFQIENRTVVANICKSYLKGGKFH